MNSRSLLLSMLAASTTMLGSCNVAGPAFYFIHGPEKVKPQYELPPERSAVVFIDDRANALPSRTTRRAIAKAAEQTLLKSKAVGKADIISSDAILSVAAQERFGKPTGIAEVGKAVGAGTVIYATVDRFVLSPDGVEYAPEAELRVKVVDVESRRRLWPTGDREWAPVQVRQPTRTGSAPASSVDRMKAESVLAERIGENIAHLFVEHEQTDLTKRIGE